jgi:CRP-like cAMP-binding protein
MQLEQATQLLKSCELLRDLSAADVMDLIGELEPVSHPAGHVLFTRGSEGNAFFIVLDGLVDLVVPVGAVIRSTPVAQLSEIVAGTVGPGGFFGEIACLEPEGRRTAGAVSRTDCQVLPVPRDRFLAFLRAHPNAALAVIRFLGGRVRHYTNVNAGIRNTNELLDARRQGQNLWERLSDQMADWSAQWSFTRANLLLWALWLGTAAGPHLAAHRSTAASFGVNALTLFVSLQSIVMTTFVLVSQKRAHEASRLQDEQHYLAALTTRETTHLVLERLDRLERRLDARPTGSTPSRP